LEATLPLEMFTLEARESTEFIELLVALAIIPAKTEFLSAFCD
jgi:hypothetical protein